MEDKQLRALIESALPTSFKNHISTIHITAVNKEAVTPDQLCEIILDKEIIPKTARPKTQHTEAMFDDYAGTKMEQMAESFSENLTAQIVKNALAARVGKPNLKGVNVDALKKFALPSLAKEIKDKSEHFHPFSLFVRIGKHRVTSNPEVEIRHLWDKSSSFSRSIPGMMNEFVTHLNNVVTAGNIDESDTGVLIKKAEELAAELKNNLPLNPRDVIFAPDEAQTMVAKLVAEGWHHIATPVIDLGSSKTPDGSYCLKVQLDGRYLESILKRTAPDTHTTPGTTTTEPARIVSIGEKGAAAGIVN